MLRRGYSANQIEDIKNALKAMHRYDLSIWDSLIIAAALKAKASSIITEDLSSGQNYGWVIANNPFG